MQEDLLLQELLHIGVLAASTPVSAPPQVVVETAPLTTVNAPTTDVTYQIREVLESAVVPFIETMKARLARLTKVHTLMGQELQVLTNELAQFEAGFQPEEVPTAPGGDS